MKTQLDEKRDLMHKVERLSSIEEIQKLKIFIAGMEAGKVAKENTGEGERKERTAK